MAIIKLGSPDVYRQSGASISYIEGLLSAAIPDVPTHRKNADAGFLDFLVRPKAEVTTSAFSSVKIPESRHHDFLQIK